MAGNKADLERKRTVNKAGMSSLSLQITKSFRSSSSGRPVRIRADGDFGRLEPRLGRASRRARGRDTGGLRPEAGVPNGRPLTCPFKTGDFSADSPDGGRLPRGHPSIFDEEEERSAGRAGPRKVFLAVAGGHLQPAQELEERIHPPDPDVVEIGESDLALYLP